MIIIYNVYKITNKINNKIYIGQTIKPIQTRFREHIAKAKVKNTKFYRALNKYGEENFEISLIDTANSQEELDEKEFYWMKYYDAVNKGYNSYLRKGKVGGDTLTNHPEREKICKKISEAVMGEKNIRARKIKAINIKTKEEFIFGSMCECARELKFSNHIGISKRCRGLIKTPYKQEWLFEYVN